MSLPSKASRPALTSPGNGTSPISASMARLLPEPDSPTMPRISPCSSVSDTRSTARSGPAAEGNSTVRSSMSSKAMPLTA